MWSGRAASLAAGIALSALGVRCAAFGSSPAVGQDGGAGFEGAVPNEGGTCERPARAPPGAVFRPANCHAYLFIRSMAISWDDADTAAQNLGGHLVTVTSAEENAFVFEILNREVDAAYSLSPPEFWVGPWLGAVRDA